MLFLDFEASTIEGGSYPVEVGWCSHDLTSGGSMLIKPCPGWEAWSPVSEGMHKISRQRLLDDSRPAAEVMTTLNAEIGNAEVISDNPEFDQCWLDILAEGAQVKALFKVDQTPLDAVLVAASRRAGVAKGGASPLVLPMMRRAAGIRLHRALDDCINHAFALGLIAIQEVERSKGKQSATELHQGLIERAKTLLAVHGRKA